MRPNDLAALGNDLFSTWEGAVAFRLFADQDIPTLTVPEQIAARLGVARWHASDAPRMLRWPMPMSCPASAPRAPGWTVGWS